jgi:hypothetical protein
LLDVGKLLAEDAAPSLLAHLRDSGVTQVYLETFRRENTPKNALQEAMTRCEVAGLKAGGWITPHGFDHSSSAGSGLACYSHPRTQEELAEAVRQSASLLGEVLLDRFLCTDCECSLCRSEKKRRSWPEFRRGLMNRTLREHVIAPAREVNPDAKISLVLPARYEEARAYGYDVGAQMQVVHRFIVERPLNRNDPGQVGERTVSALTSRYAFCLWLRELAGRKAGGAFISNSTLSFSEEEEKESARPATPIREQVVEAAEEMALAGASEMILDCRPDSSVEFDFLKEFQPDVERLAEVGRKTPLRGVAVYRPASGGVVGVPDETETLRLLGLPLRPTPRFPSSSKTAFFTDAALSVGDLPQKLDAFLQSGGFAYVTASVLRQLKTNERWTEAAEELGVWPYSLNPAEVQEAESGPVFVEDLERMRQRLLAPLGVGLDAPPGVTLSLFGFSDAVIQNYNSVPASVSIIFPGKSLRIAASSEGSFEDHSPLEEEIVLPPHSWIHLRV